MRDELKVKIASVPDREGLVGELWQGNEMWAEIFLDEMGTLVLEVYPHASGGPWSFPFQDAIRSLNEARTRLLELPRDGL